MRKEDNAWSIVPDEISRLKIKHAIQYRVRVLFSQRKEASSTTSNKQINPRVKPEELLTNHDRVVRAIRDQMSKLQNQSKSIEVRLDDNIGCQDDSIQKYMSNVSVHVQKAVAPRFLPTCFMEMIQFCEDDSDMPQHMLSFKQTPSMYNSRSIQESLNATKNNDPRSKDMMAASFSIDDSMINFGQLSSTTVDYGDSTSIGDNIDWVNKPTNQNLNFSDACHTIDNDEGTSIDSHGPISNSCHEQTQPKEIFMGSNAISRLKLGFIDIRENSYVPIDDDLEFF